MIAIKCPNCQRVLGTTNDNLSATLFCKGCKAKSNISIKVAKSADYLNKEEK